MLKNIKKIISIIVANYNNAKYLPECLDSILSQTYRNIEIVIADDCSTDDSREILSGYAIKYPDIIRLVYLEKNGGVARARHEAIVQSTGEYITTLDADDYYADEKKLEKEMELIRYHKENSCRDIVAFSNIVIQSPDDSQKVQGNDKNIHQGTVINKMLARDCMIPRDFTMLKSIYFEVGGYNQKLPIYEDWDLKIRIAANYEFYYTGINGTAYRRHGNGLSSAQAPKHIKYLKKVFKNYIYLIPAIQKKEVQVEFNKFIANMNLNYLNRLKKELKEHRNRKHFRGIIGTYRKILSSDFSYINVVKFRRLYKSA